MNSILMDKAVQLLDQKLQQKKRIGVKILIGGGGAFALAYHIPIHTADIDGMLFKSAITPAELDLHVKAVGRELEISLDWLNPYFETFLGCLPADYGDRLKEVFRGKALTVYALGLADLLIMKCFAGREKDLPHAKALIRKGADVDFVERHLEILMAKTFPKAKEALEFLIDAEEQVGG